jgi:ArsR family transcriptional regulator
MTWLERSNHMELENAAKRCAELGNTTRLSIFRLLVRAGKDGLPVGEIQRNLGIPGSTLSHHIQRLVQVGLLNQRRDSRVLYCEPQFEAVRELADFLVSECCSLQTQIDPKTVD